MIKKIVFLIFTCLLLITCDNSTVENTFDRKSMFSNLADSLFSQQINTFNSSVDLLFQLSQDSLNTSNLLKLQNQWKVVAKNWKPIEFLNYGAIKESFVVDKIYRALNLTKWNELLMDSTALTDIEIQNLAASVKGLHAIEKLLFNPEKNNHDIALDLQANKRQESLLRGLISDLNDRRSELASAWQQQYISFKKIGTERYRSEMDALDDVMNHLIMHVEAIRFNYLATPRGAASGGIKMPNTLEAYNARYSRELMVEFATSLQGTFQSGNDVSLQAYINSVHLETGRKFEKKMQALVDEAIGVQQNYAEALENGEELTPLFNAFTNLIIFLKADVVQRLSITLYFTDNDGD